jgi:hypothetical protein
MERPTEKLIRVGGEALSPTEPILPAGLLDLAGPLAGELIEFLKKKNGFYAFESALHVMPAQACGPEIGLVDWNSEHLWIHEYGGMAKGLFFFAEDIFGCQFCIRADGIYQFDPETGQVEKLATDLDGWTDAILRDYSYLTGYPLAHEWQQANGAIAAGVRLVPKQPFVTGGEFSVQNLAPLDAVAAMRMRGQIAMQIKDLPDGARIELRVVD